MKQKYRFDIKQMSADCEANYARLCRLFPQLIAIAVESKEATGNGSGCTELAKTSREILLEFSTEQPGRLRFQVKEQCRYTTLLELIVDLNWRPSNTAQAPASVINCTGAKVKMLVRMYHDASLAEVVAFSGKRSKLASYKYPNETMFQPDEKAQQNRFLAEVLSIGLQRGMSAPCDTGAALWSMLTNDIN